MIALPIGLHSMIGAGSVRSSVARFVVQGRECGEWRHPPATAMKVFSSFCFDQEWQIEPQTPNGHDDKTPIAALSS